MSALKRTPLYACYEYARCIDFGGWELPVQFAGIQKEHDAVRHNAGLFDVSHMGEVLITGPAAEAYIQRLTTNDAARLEAGQAQYSLMCYPEGGVVDDLLVYRLGAEQFMFVINASNIEKDWEWMNRHLTGDVELRNISDTTALLALQGPRSEAILSKLVPVALQEIRSFRFVPDVPLLGTSALISRTGYTGEDGFEIYVDAKDAPRVWTSLLETGQSDGLVPAGLGARDTLRFEARLPLYGHELSDTISPLEAGLGAFVKLDKGDFVGREALIRQKGFGPARKLVGIEMIDRGIPRAHYKVFAADGHWIGDVTTGTQSPTLKKNLGMALIASQYAAPGTEISVEIRDKLLKARVVKTPFYKRNI